MTENSIVANAKASSGKDQSALDGAGMAQDLWDAGNKFSEGKIFEGFGNLVGAGMDVSGFVQDPMAALVSMGMGWLMEHVSFLKEPLDMLTGDQQSLDVMVKTWEGVSNHIEEASTELAGYVKADSALWVGEGTESYRAFATNLGDMYSGVAGGAKAVSIAIDTCKSVLNIARAIVRGLIGDFVGKLISIMLRYPGPAAPAGLAAEGMPAAVQTGGKIMKYVRQVIDAFKEAAQKLKNLGTLFQDVSKMLREAVSSQGSKAFGISRTFGSGVGAASKDGVNAASDAFRTSLSEAGITAQARAAGTGALDDLTNNIGKQAMKERVFTETVKESTKKTTTAIQPEVEEKPETPHKKVASEPLFQQSSENRISGSIDPD